MSPADGTAGAPTGDGTVRWGDLLTEAEARLSTAGLPSAAMDARRIVEEVSGLEGARLTLERGSLVSERAMAAYDSMVARRSSGEPLQYVLGRWGFRSLDLMVDHRALIPRPETEGLVDIVLERVDELVEAGLPSPVTVVDLGTGTGAIALSVATERVGTTVWATDASTDALALARANLAGIGRAGARVRLAEGSWFVALDDELASGVGVIVSNPPYVADTDELPADVADWEPTSALLAGAEGLDDLRVIVAEAPRWLVPGGSLVVELDPRQAETVAGLMTSAGFDEVAIIDDLTGRARYVAGRIAVPG